MKKVWKITQYLLSTFSAGFFIIINLMEGWGSYNAQRLGMPILVIYNIFDIILGQYWKKDRLMLLHHIAVVAFGSYIWYLDDFNDIMYRVSFWISLGELSSLLNSVRWFFYGTEWEKQSKMAFALAFLFIRPISNIGLINVLKDFRTQLITLETMDICQIDINDNYLFGYNMLFLSTAIYTGLNLYWGGLITNKFYRYFVEV